MTMSRYPHGVSVYGIPVYGSGPSSVLGPGCGKIVWMVATKAESNLYYKQLHDNGVSDNDMYTTLTTALAATTASRNDVILATPGTYTETAEVAWSKANTHLVGLGGPNARGDYGEPNVVIYTTTAAVGATVNITGQNCQFYNVTIQNAGNDAGNLCAVLLNKYGCYFENVSIQGNLASTQRSTAACSSLYISTNGHYPMFVNCNFGNTCWGAISGANQASCVRFVGSQPNDGHFKNCRFLSDSSTASVVAVSAPLNCSAGRNWLWEDCFFYNYNSTPGTNLNQVFYIAGPAPTHGFAYKATLRGCTANGWDEWTDADNDRFFADMPITGLGGGLVREPTAAAGN